jgi:lipoprotein-releasing system permease protein
LTWISIQTESFLVPDWLLRIGVGTGDNVAVITSDGIDKVFKVIGLIETGANTADRSRAIVSIQTARQLFSKNKSYATEVMVNIQDYSDAKVVAPPISQLLIIKLKPGKREIVSSIRRMY